MCSRPAFKAWHQVWSSTVESAMAPKHLYIELLGFFFRMPAMGDSPSGTHSACSKSWVQAEHCKSCSMLSAWGDPYIKNITENLRNLRQRFPNLIGLVLSTLLSPAVSHFKWTSTWVCYSADSHNYFSTPLLWDVASTLVNTDTGWQCSKKEFLKSQVTQLKKKTTQHFTYSQIFKVLILFFRGLHA